MNAIRVQQFGGPEVLQVADVPDPSPGEGQVLVAVKAIGVNPVEAYIRAGTYAVKPNLPYTPGGDAAGVVEAVGDGVTRVKPGDRVYTAGTVSGAYAAKALCNEPQIHALPEHVTFPQGAALNIPYATAYRALFLRARAVPSETVLIHGASGGVGTAAVQWARAGGLTVVGTAGTPRGIDLVKSVGAHHVFGHHTAGYLEQAIALTGGKGFEVILEMLANVNLGNDLAALAKHGRVVVIGSRGKVEIDPRLIMGRDADIRGMTLMNATPHELAQIHAAIATGLQNRTLNPIINCEMALGDAAKAHELVMAGGAYGKIVLVP